MVLITFCCRTGRCDKQGTGPNAFSGQLVTELKKIVTLVILKYANTVRITGFYAGPIGLSAASVRIFGVLLHRQIYEWLTRGLCDVHYNKHQTTNSIYLDDINITCCKVWCLCFLNIEFIMLYILNTREEFAMFVGLTNIQGTLTAYIVLKACIKLKPRCPFKSWFLLLHLWSLLCYLVVMSDIIVQRSSERSPRRVHDTLVSPIMKIGKKHQISRPSHTHSRSI